MGYTQKIVEGVATLAASVYPKRIIVRLSDFKSKEVNEVLEKNGLKRGEDGLKVQMMAELPSNVFLADEFLEYFDGFSIGSNDLTQLTLGLDRDSGLVAQYFDERNPAVMKGLETLIKAAKAKKKYVGICGQG